MFSVWTLSGLLIGYLLLLFCLAFWAERRIDDNKQRPWVYSFALGIHCTSWAFFGTSTQAAHYGWAFIPTYLGIILVFVFAFGFIRKIAHFCQQNNISSLADFIAAQFQQSHLLAATVSVLCFLGVVPYIALQLDAVTRSFALLSNTQTGWQENLGLYVTVFMALFAILFGTRTLSLTDKHPGLMLTIAFESMIKMAALIAVGLFVCYGLFDGVFDLLGQAANHPRAEQIISADFAPWVYVSHILLGICAVFCLPRQFHITFIENNGDEELRLARWAFPLYLTLMTLFVLPVALAGHVLFAEGDVSTDIYALALPMLAGSAQVSLIAFIGGLSAATSMIIVATLAVGIMISNNLATPLWLTLQLSRNKHHVLKPGTVLLIRRLTVVLVLGIAYLYHRDVSQAAPLVKSGIIAMALLAQTVPIIVLGMIWHRGNRIAALVSLLSGAACWFVWLLWPSIKASYYFDPPPDDLQLGVGFMLSLAVNLACFVILSWLLPSNKTSRSSDAEPHGVQAVKLASLRALTEKVLAGTQQTQAEALLSEAGESGYASPQLVTRIEQALAAQVGGASARILISTISEKAHLPLPALVELVGEASQTFQFNQELLQSSVQHIQQGICVLDQDLNLIAWNQRYLEMFDYPQGLVSAGKPIRELLEFNAARGMLGDSDNSEMEIEKRLQYLRQGSRYKYVRKQQDGKVIELNGSPLPGGGFVTTYSDITEYITIQRQLQDAKSNLEQRVAQRTEQFQQANALLAEAKQAADDANESKTKFLAAAGHDLMQPFNAASLFASLISQRADGEDIRNLSQNLIQSLTSAEELLSMLLDMTRLESGALTPHVQAFPLDEILTPLIKEFSLLAQQKSLQLKYVPTQLWVQSDKKLLRRVLQNLISNAIRYTEKGKILVGTRRSGNALWLQVYDTGPGIAESDRQAIFREFNQLNPDQTKQGLGLGLTIVDRISQLLGHQLRLDSQVHSGTLFAIEVPRCKAGKRPASSRPRPRQDSPDWLNGRTLLVAENEPHTLQAVSQLLSSWGARVVSLSSVDEVSALTSVPDLMLLDYHLNHGETGLDVAAAVRQKFNQPIAGILNSADRDEAIRSAAVDANLGYLPKPLKPAAFKRLVKQLLAKKEVDALS